METAKYITVLDYEQGDVCQYPIELQGIDSKDIIAIETLESIAHWMKKSSFNYKMIDLERALNEVKQDYKKYLDENI